MRQLNFHDRVGLGWRAELAAGILLNASLIDVIEVVVDDYFSAPRARLRALETLAAQIPIICHGVSLGLASTHPVNEKRLSGLARVMGFLRPEFWSEHLAFVRAGGNEIGHLAAPPRTRETISGALKNLQRTGHVVGSLPHLENIATLVDPPCSTLDEAAWTSAILHESGTGMLLDLHNLYANACNFGRDPFAEILRFPLAAVRLVHLSGGHWIHEPAGAARFPHAKRLLDDHVHDIPDIVFDMLERLAENAPHDLTVIIERDGCYPEMEILIEQINRARSALQAGRLRRKEVYHECA